MRVQWTVSFVVVAIGVSAGGLWLLQTPRDPDPVLTVAMDSGSEVDETALEDELKPSVSVMPAVPLVVDNIIVENRTQSEVTKLSAADELHLSKLQGGVALHNIPGALQFLESLADTQNVQDLMVSLIRQWAQYDVLAAAEWAENLSPGAVRTKALQGVAIAFVDQDVLASIEWAWTLPAGSDRNSTIQCLGYEAARTEPKVALTIAVGSLPATKERDGLIKHATLQWASSDPWEAAEWAVQLQDEELRDRVIVNVATAWSDSNPESAADFAVLNIEPGRAQNDAVVGIVQRWVQVDPEAAADWVAAFPKGELYDIAAENLRKLWPDQTF
jgi:hypothetical protein